MTSSKTRRSWLYVILLLPIAAAAQQNPFELGGHTKLRLNAQS